MVLGEKYSKSRALLEIFGNSSSLLVFLGPTSLEFLASPSSHFFTLETYMMIGKPLGVCDWKHDFLLLF